MGSEAAGPAVLPVTALDMYHGIYLTESFWDQQRAVTVLKHYFAPLSGDNAGYTGAVWDTFDPSGTRASSADVFTPEDVVACALLSTPIGGRAAVELLQTRREEFAQLLSAIGPDRAFVDAAEQDPSALGFEEVRALYRALRTLPGIGETRATKLLARKRPNLVPIVDSVIDRVIFHGSGVHWAPLHVAMTADDHTLWKWLEEIKNLAELSEQVPVLRVFDVLAWMDGTGNSDTMLGDGEIAVDGHHDSE